MPKKRNYGTTCRLAGSLPKSVGSSFSTDHYLESERYRKTNGITAAVCFWLKANIDIVAGTRSLTYLLCHEDVAPIRVISSNSLGWPYNTNACMTRVMALRCHTIHVVGYRKHPPWDEMLLVVVSHAESVGLGEQIFWASQVGRASTSISHNFSHMGARIRVVIGAFTKVRDIRVLLRDNFAAMLLG